MRLSSWQVKFVSLSLSRRRFNGGGELGRNIPGHRFVFLEPGGRQRHTAAGSRVSCLVIRLKTINNFVAPATGTYYAVVSGFTEQDYVLEVLKNAVFEDSQLNDASFSAGVGSKQQCFGLPRQF